MFPDLCLLNRCVLLYESDQGNIFLTAFISIHQFTHYHTVYSLSYAFIDTLDLVFKTTHLEKLQFCQIQILQRDKAA